MIEAIRKERPYGLGVDVQYPILAGHTITIRDSGVSYAAAKCSCGWEPKWTHLTVARGYRAVVRHIRRRQRDVLKQTKVRMLNEYRLAKAPK